MRKHIEGLFSLEGRVALVTGASGGIGSEMAYSLAMAGAYVALSGRSHERLDSVCRRITADGGSAGIFAGEAEDLEQIKKMAADVIEARGGVDILINCAGINRREPIEEVSSATFDRLIDVNLRAPYFLSQAVVDSMASRGGGKIINIGSLTTAWGVGNLSVYGLTKSAIGQMTRVMAVEWASKNIQVNCICPGWIKTELTAPVWADPVKSTWLLQRIPAGRPGAPSDLSGIALYLSSRAADYTTGQAFYVDGGFMAGGQW